MPQQITCPQPIAAIVDGGSEIETRLLRELGPDQVFMMGDDPALTKMPERPRLLDFFRFRMTGFTFSHLLNSAKLALEAGLDEAIVLACLLHDISTGALIRTDHGYWGAQLIAPYVGEEVSWAVRYHQ